MINQLIVQEKIKAACTPHNLAVLGVGCLLLAAFAFGLVFPTFKEIERLEAEIPREERRLAQTREIHLVAQALEGKRSRLQEAMPAPPRELGEAYRDTPVALRRLADEHGLEVRRLTLEIPDRAGQAMHMKMRAELTGDLEPLRRLALEMAWLPSLVRLQELMINREEAGFALTALLIVDDE